MSKSYYSKINLHITWHTKGSLPLLTPALEPIAHRMLRKRIIETPDVLLHEIGGTATHVHMAVSIPPTLTISTWVGQLKGGSSHDVNQQVGMRQKALQWQIGYGVVSFGTGDQDWVAGYIRNQKKHHDQGSFYERLERITHDDDPLPT